jgi:hypothetical protein
MTAGGFLSGCARGGFPGDRSMRSRCSLSRRRAMGLGGFADSHGAMAVPAEAVGWLLAAASGAGRWAASAGWCPPAAPECGVAWAASCGRSATRFDDDPSGEPKMMERAHSTMITMAMPPMMRGVAYFLKSNPLMLFPIAALRLRWVCERRQAWSKPVLLALSELSDISYPDGDMGGVKILN